MFVLQYVDVPTQHMHRDNYILFEATSLYLPWCIKQTYSYTPFENYELVECVYGYGMLYLKCTPTNCPENKARVTHICICLS